MRASRRLRSVSSGVELGDGPVEEALRRCTGTAEPLPALGVAGRHPVLTGQAGDQRHLGMQAGIVEVDGEVDGDGQLALALVHLPIHSRW